jgi:tetratricopeptide (TPR) repeat protein
VNKKYGKYLKWGAVLVILLIVAYFAAIFPKATSLDFSHIRLNIQATVSKDQPAPPATDSAELLADAARGEYLNEYRAKEYLQTATKDYYHGSYEDALRRLDRAKIYDPTNYGIFKLSGQIFFERNKFRKAFNNWERANALPNDDRTISRDLNVLKRLIRYSRTEIDSLQRTINKNPDNRLARARLKELEDQMRE